MLAAVLILISASVILILGVAHLVYTFWGPKLTPRDPELLMRMQHVSPVMTKETTMWRAWVGFNASHSLGLILFGLIYGFLALTQAGLLFHSAFLLSLGFFMLCALWVVGKFYWFRIPFAGISVALVCYVGAMVLQWL